MFYHPSLHTEAKSFLRQQCAKGLVCPSPPCRGGTGDEESISSPPANPGIDAKRQGHLWDHIPLPELGVTVCHSCLWWQHRGRAEGQTHGEGNVCPLFPALGRSLTTSLLCKLSQPLFF